MTASFNTEILTSFRCFNYHDRLINQEFTRMEVIKQVNQSYVQTLYNDHQRLAQAIYNKNGELETLVTYHGMTEVIRIIRDGLVTMVSVLKDGNVDITSRDLTDDEVKDIIEPKTVLYE